MVGASFVGCNNHSEVNPITSSSSESVGNSSETSQINNEEQLGTDELLGVLDEGSLDSMRKYATIFAQKFPEQFDSTSKLDAIDIGMFSFWQIYEEMELQVDESGACQVAKSDLVYFVSERFGIEGYEYQESVPELNVSTNMYSFFPVGEGALTHAEVVEEVISDNTITFTISLQAQDFETGSPLPVIERYYKFLIYSLDGDYVLQSISAI